MIWSPFDRSIKHDPYPHYAEKMRQSGLFVAPSNIVFSLNHDSSRYILNREEEFRSAPPSRGGRHALPAFDRVMWHCLLINDGARHRQNRASMTRFFSLEEAEKNIEAHTSSLLEKLGNMQSFDLVNDLIEPVVAGTLIKTLGFDPGVQTKAIEWSETLLKSVDIFVSSKDYQEMEEASLEFERFIGQSIHDQQIRGFTSHIYQRLKDTQSHNEALSKTASFTSTLLFTGINTAVGLIGNILFKLLSEPELLVQLTALRKAQGEIPSTATDELIRLCPSVHFTFRFANQETSIGGTKVDKNQVIAICLASANRDSEVFDNPDSFVPERQPNPHLSFGTGKHYCFGAKLARMHLKVILSYLLESLPKLRLQSRFPVYKKYNFVQAPASITVQTI